MTDHSTAGDAGQLIRVGTQRLRVDIRPGDRSVPPLLMFGGIGAGLEVFQPLVDSIDSAIEVIRVDVPGIGGSPAGLLPYAFPQLALLMSKLLDELGHPRADVLGFSWGGALAQQFALQCSGHCRRLVLISTSTGLGSLPGDPRVLWKMLTPQHFSDPQDVVTMLGHLGDLVPAGSLRFGGTAADGGVVGYLHQLLAVFSWSSLPFLPLIGQRTLVLSGDEDPIVPPANARLVAGLIPRAELQVYPGGHAEIVNSAADLGRRISTFLLDTTD